tara:strand:+ start:376 stop:591 length:216 start_codon:yes stop_codon:yes gene_type:complete
VFLQRVAKAVLLHHGVPVPTTHPLADDIPGFLQVANDHLDGTFGDADFGGHIPHPRLRITRQRDEHVPVVG